MGSYCLVSDLSFLGQASEGELAGPFQVFLDNSCTLESFESNFRPGYWSEVVLVTLIDDLGLSIERSHASLFLLQNPFSAFDAELVWCSG